MRHVQDTCEKFTVGDEAKQEFYSPNYPDNYPNLTECTRVLKGEQTVFPAIQNAAGGIVSFIFHFLQTERNVLDIITNTEHECSRETLYRNGR